MTELPADATPAAAPHDHEPDADVADQRRPAAGPTADQGPAEPVPFEASDGDAADQASPVAGEDGEEDYER